MKDSSPNESASQNDSSTLAFKNSILNEDDSQNEDDDDCESKFEAIFLEPNQSSDVPASSSIPFDIPFHILKNITPVKSKLNHSTSKSDNTHKLRKQQQLEDKSLKLRQKQQLINERINEVKRRQEVLIEKNSLKLNKSLELANERRNKFLDDVKNKARLSFEKHRRFTTCFLIKDETTVGDSYVKKDCDKVPHENLGRVILIQKNIKKNLFFKDVAKFRKFHPFDTLLNSSYKRNISLLKDGSEISILISRILRFINLPDLDKYNHYKNFKFAFILISDLKDSIKLGQHSGMNSNINSSIFHDQLYSAFNHNYTRIDGHGIISNSLPFLTFKLAHWLIYSLDEFLNLSYEKILNPISIERLKLGKIWKFYHYVFQIFKSVHLSNCVSIANEALDIINKQLEVLDLEEKDVAVEGIEQNKKDLLAKDTFLTKLSNNEAGIKEWTDIGIHQGDFIQSIQRTMESKVFPVLPLMKADSDLLENKYSEEYVDENVNLIQLGSKKFFIPPAINQLTWRKFHVDKFRSRQLEKKHAYNIPQVIQTGLKAKLPKAKAHIDDHQDLMALGLTDIIDEYEDLQNVKEFGILSNKFHPILCRVFTRLYHFCYFSDTCYRDAEAKNLLQDVHQTFLRLKDYIDEEHIEMATYSETIDYFRLHLILLKGLREFASLNWIDGSLINRLESDLSKMVDELTDLDREEEYDPYYSDSSDRAQEYIQGVKSQIILLYCEIESTLFRKWYEYCKFDNIKDYFRFENIFTFISNESHRIEMGTNSPTFRYPIFYRFYYKYYPDLYWKSDTSFKFDYLKMIQASYHLPNFQTDPMIFQSKSLEFLRKLLVSFVTHDDGKSLDEKIIDSQLENNEVLHLFKDDLIKLLVQFESLIKSNYILMFVANFDVNRRNLLVCEVQGMGEYLIKGFEASLTNTDLVIDQFLDRFSYCLFRYPNLGTFLKKRVSARSSHAERIMKSSFKSICLSKDYSKLTPTFKYVHPESMKLISSLHELVKLNYEIYHPLISWLFRDTGEL